MPEVPYVLEEESGGGRGGGPAEEEERGAAVGERLGRNIKEHSQSPYNPGAVRTPEEEAEEEEGGGKKAVMMPVRTDVSVRSTEASPSSIREGGEGSSLEEDEEEEEREKKKMKDKERLCCICREKEGIYRCARCLQRTCSLPCYKAHEKRKREDGQRNAAALGLHQPTSPEQGRSLQPQEKHRDRADGLDRKEKDEGKEENVPQLTTLGEPCEGRQDSGHLQEKEDRHFPQEDTLVGSSTLLSSSSSSSICPLIRPRVQPVRCLRDFDDQVFLKDFRLLEEASRAVEAAARQWRADAEDSAQKSKRRSVVLLLAFFFFFSSPCLFSSFSLLFCPIQRNFLFLLGSVR